MFYKKLASLAQLNSQISELWYVHGKIVKGAHPEMTYKELHDLIVQAIWAEAHHTDNLMQWVCVHDPCVNGGTFIC